MTYLRRLHTLAKRHGPENIVYFDESGFKKHSYRRHGWARRGQIIYGGVSGNNRKHENLIMAQRDGQWLAPETFEETCDAKRVNEWLERKLIPLLARPGVVVMDNASFHKKKDIRLILKKPGTSLCRCHLIPRTSIPLKTALAHSKEKESSLPRKLRSAIL